MAAPTFRLTDENAPIVAEICLRLDGLPLALELAAARLKFLTPREVLTRLTRRFSLLIGGGRDLPDRQRTLRETVAWSYGLLTAGQQALLRRLAVFDGGCTLAAAEAVLAAIDGEPSDPDALADDLAALVDQSLLWRDQEATGGARLRMMETIREYGRDQLAEHGELDAACRAHAAYYLALAEEFQSQQTGAEQGRWLTRLEDERGNLRAIFAWALRSGAGVIALRLGVALVSFWRLRGYHREALHLLEQALGREANIPDELRARACNAAGQLALFLNDKARARAFLDQGLSYSRRTGDLRELGDLLSSLGWALTVRGDYAEAEAAFRESVDLSLQAGHRGSAAWAFNGLGNLALRRGAFDEALANHQKGLDLFAAERDEQGVAFALTAFGLLYLQRGDLERATASYRDSLAAYRALKSAGGVAAALDGLALVAIAQGDDRRAARLFGVAQATHSEPIVGVTALNREQRDATVAAVRDRLGEAAFAAAWAAGRALTVDRAVAEASAQAPSRQVCADGLTPRELAVLRLVAQGLSDAEVADRLFLSRRTVQSYLSTVYGKLGVNSRTAAVRQALDRGVLEPGSGRDGTAHPDANRRGGE
jgi:DNA-binding CsgD family transcriptional regulator/Tfp pilus assembly protein PilF